MALCHISPKIRHEHIVCITQTDCKQRGQFLVCVLDLSLEFRAILSIGYAHEVTKQYSHVYIT